MVLLRNRGLRYQVGFALFFIAFVVFTCSLVIPGIWIYDRDSHQHSVAHGHSVWNLHFPTCMDNRGHNDSAPWRCDYFDDSHALGEKTMALFLMMAGLVTQLVACVVITVQITHGHLLPAITPFLPETMAGCAVLLCLTGVTIYIRYTYYALNVRYGPGVFLHYLACGLGYVGLFLTAMYRTMPPAPVPPLQHRS